MENDPDKPLSGMEAVLHMIFEPQLDAMMNDFAEATSYLVTTLDPTTLYRNYIGPFPDLDAACVYRARAEQQLNEDLEEGEEPYQVTVLPMYPPDVPDE